MTEFAVEADGLVKRFGSMTALDGVSLRVRAGSVCAVLGRNGAGKTTAVRILTTLSKPDSGSGRVAGFDVVSQARQVRSRIGVVGQSTSMDELLSGRNNLEVIGRLYHLRPARARERADELLAKFRLTDAADRLTKTYSGGMRRRLDLAASLVVDPQVLFLDEPTTGLDPIARAEVWQSVRDLVLTGTSVLLTTQYLEEADQLADSIVVIDQGRIAASGSPTELKRRVGSGQVRLQLVDSADAAAAVAVLQAELGGPVTLSGPTFSAQAPGGMDSLAAVIAALRHRQIEVEDIGLQRPSLDEVFESLTSPNRPQPADALALTN